MPILQHQSYLKTAAIPNFLSQHIRYAFSILEESQMFVN